MFPSNDLRNLRKVATLEVHQFLKLYNLQNIFASWHPLLKKHSPGQYLGTIGKPQLANLSPAGVVVSATPHLISVKNR